MIEEIPTEELVAETLLDVKAVTLSPTKPYTYASGILSPIYCDNRLLISYPTRRNEILDEFIRVIEKNKLEFDVVAGTATAGIPHAAWIADRLDKPMIYVRGKSKEHGKENLIEGVFNEDARVLVVEDLISTGGSSIDAVEEIRKQGGNVIGCIAIFTYEMETAKKKFEKAKCKLYTLSNFSTLLKVAENNNYITSDDKEKVMEWNKDPEGWGKKMGLE